jgi:hypothetical protein
VGRVVVKSATSTVNLVVAGAATVGAAAAHSLPILALGGIAYAALIAWDLASPAFWKKASDPEPAAFPEIASLTDTAAREAVQSFLDGRARLEAVLAETPDEVRRHLGGVLRSIRELEVGAIRLVQRAEGLSRYLATTDAEPVRREAKKLAEKAKAARDEATRQDYESAKALREEQLRALDDIAAARERALANLTRMIATLESLPPKIVRMRALDAQAMDALSGSMSDELERINGDMKAFEETLAGLGEATRS